LVEQIEELVDTNLEQIKQEEESILLEKATIDQKVSKSKKLLHEEYSILEERKNLKLQRRNQALLKENELKQREIELTKREEELSLKYADSEKNHKELEFRLQELNEKHNDLKYKKEFYEALDKRQTATETLISAVEQKEQEVQKMQKLLENLKQEKAAMEKQAMEKSQHILKQLEIYRNYGLTPKQKALDDFLKSIKREMKKRKITFPKCFISYAWEEEEQKRSFLQSYLRHIKSDLEKAGIKVLLDISNLISNMQEYMKHEIDTSDFILFIGTPRLKERLEVQHSHIYFEYMCIRDKLKKKPNALLPIFLEGNNYEHSFLDEILKIHLIRDFRNENDYLKNLTSLANPIGLIPTILDLSTDKDYKQYLKSFETSLKLIASEEKL